MINVNQLKDNTFQISWDPNDPLESILNNWTEEDFIQAIMEDIKSISKKNKTSFEVQRWCKDDNIIHYEITDAVDYDDAKIQIESKYPQYTVIAVKKL